VESDGHVLHSKTATSILNVAAVRENWEGQLIGDRFPLLQWLGSSEHSAVFLTELRGQGQVRAAIKLMTADTENAKTRISRWEMVAGLSHPHLMRLFHAGQCEIDAAALLYVVMEYADEELSQVLPLRPLSAAEAGEMLSPVADVLSFLHRKGLVHGHIRPSNIMAVDNQLKLSCDSLHLPGELYSAYEPSVYNAPEAEPWKILPTADVWSLGITLVTALSQQTPTGEKSGEGELILPESIPDPFQEIARECLRRKPGDRCTPENIVSRLDPTSVHLKIIAGSAVATKWRRLRNIISGLAAAIVVLVGFAGARLASHHTPTQPTLTTNGAEQPTAGSALLLPSTRSAEFTTPKPKDVVAHGLLADGVLPDMPTKAGGQAWVFVNPDRLPNTRVEARTNALRKREMIVRVGVDREGRARAVHILRGDQKKMSAVLETARHWSFQPCSRTADCKHLLRFTDYGDAYIVQMID
jgi:hypothetical protein